MAVRAATIAKLWIGNVAPEVTDAELRTFLTKHGFPEPSAVERIADQGPRPAVAVDLPGEISADLAPLAGRLHDLFWPLNALRQTVASRREPVV
jgi:hypothetical protein